jgi:hypothetical protein
MNFTTISDYLSVYFSPFAPYIHLPPRIHILASRLLSLLPPTINLSLAPLLVLASFSHIPKRTIQIGTSSLLDALIVSPGLHTHSTAATLNDGEYPATAALTTGYVFRTENQAMVHYMQQVGVTGSLVTLRVTSTGRKEWRYVSDIVFGPGGMDAASLAAVGLTLDVLAGCWVTGDMWTLLCIGLLITSRILNVMAIRRRLSHEWHGAAEPGVMGDLLVLLSQDRWVRIKGLVDDLKAVTSGQWLRDQGWVEQNLVDAGTVLVYAAVVVGFNASHRGALMVATLLVGSSVLLSISNSKSGKTFWMHRRLVQVEGVKRYARRRIMADELIEESGRDDWAVQMGMIPGNEKGGAAIM